MPSSNGVFFQGEGVAGFVDSRLKCTPACIGGVHTRVDSSGLTEQVVGTNHSLSSRTLDRS